MITTVTSPWYPPSPGACLSVAGTNLWAYLALVEAAHACSQTEFVLFSSSPLSSHVDDRHRYHPEQHDTADWHAHRHSYLLPFTAAHNRTIRSLTTSTHQVLYRQLITFIIRWKNQRLGNCIAHAGHSITFLHFSTMWFWPLIFWLNINWCARYRDGLSLCQVRWSYFQPFWFYHANKNTHTQTHTQTDRQDQSLYSRDYRRRE